MRERPILFSAPMVKAILVGAKTVTRRLVKPQPEAPRAVYDLPAADTVVEPWRCDLDALLYGLTYRMSRLGNVEAPLSDDAGRTWRCPYGAPGDRLWVRETWRAEELEDGTDGVRYAADDSFIPIENTPDASARWSDAAYSKGKRRPVDQWRPSIFLPRWASRITLEIASVRVERLHVITEEDAICEGVDAVSVADVPHNGTLSRRDDFAQLWDAINGARVPWRLNPWVWRIEFKVAEVRRG